MITLFQSSYINKVFEKFAMQDSNKGGQSSRIGIILSLNDCSKHSRRKSILKKVHYALAVEIFLCTVCFVLERIRIQRNLFLCQFLIFVMTLLCGGVSIKLVCLLINEGHMWQPLRSLRKRFGIASSLALLRIS